MTGTKADYLREGRNAEKFYQVVRAFHDPAIWENFTGRTEREFDDPFELVHSKLQKPFDVRNGFTKGENSLRKHRARDTSERVMLFNFLHYLRSGNRGGVGLQTAKHFYGLSSGTLSNYLRHFAWTLCAVLKHNSHSSIKWPCTA